MDMLARAQRESYAAVSGERSGRMLSVTAQRLPGAASSYALLGAAVLIAVVVVAVRRRSDILIS